MLTLAGGKGVWHVSLFSQDTAPSIVTEIRLFREHAAGHTGYSALVGDCTNKFKIFGKMKKDK